MTNQNQPELKPGQVISVLLRLICLLISVGAALLFCIVMVGTPQELIKGAVSLFSSSGSMQDSWLNENLQDKHLYIGFALFVYAFTCFLLILSLLYLMRYVPSFLRYARRRMAHSSGKTRGNSPVVPRRTTRTLSPGPGLSEQKESVDDDQSRDLSQGGVVLPTHEETEQTEEEEIVELPVMQVEEDEKQNAEDSINGSGSSSEESARSESESEEFTLTLTGRDSIQITNEVSDAVDRLNEIDTPQITSVNLLNSFCEPFEDAPGEQRHSSDALLQTTTLPGILLTKILEVFSSLCSEEGVSNGGVELEDPPAVILATMGKTDAQTLAFCEIVLELPYSLMGRLENPLLIANLTEAIGAASGVIAPVVMETKTRRPNIFLLFTGIEQIDMENMISSVALLPLGKIAEALPLKTEQAKVATSNEIVQRPEDLFKEAGLLSIEGKFLLTGHLFVKPLPILISADREMVSEIDLVTLVSGIAVELIRQSEPQTRVDILADATQNKEAREFYAQLEDLTCRFEDERENTRAKVKQSLPKQLRSLWSELPLLQSQSHNKSDNAGQVVEGATSNSNITQRYFFIDLDRLLDETSGSLSSEVAFTGPASESHQGEDERQGDLKLLKEMIRRSSEMGLFFILFTRRPQEIYPLLGDICPLHLTLGIKDRALCQSVFSSQNPAHLIVSGIAILSHHQLRLFKNQTIFLNAVRYEAEQIGKLCANYKKSIAHKEETTTTVILREALPEIALKCFGMPDIMQNGHSVKMGPNNSYRQLLYLLALSCTPEKSISRQSLYSTFYEYLEPLQAHKKLGRQIAGIRLSVLRQVGLPLNDQLNYLITVNNGSLNIDWEHVEVDYQRFITLYKSAHSYRPGESRETRLIEEANEIYASNGKGNLLLTGTDLEECWQELLSIRQRAHRLYSSGQGELEAYYEKLGDNERLIDTIEKGLPFEYREDHVRRLMMLYAEHRSNRKGVKRVFDQLCAQYKSIGIGGQPEEETISLYHELTGSRTKVLSTARG